MESFLKPMLAAPGDVQPISGSWFVEPKLDGWRYVAYKDEQGELHCFGGRNGAEYTGKLPYLERELDDLLPAGTAIDGELIGEEWGEVQSVMGSNGAPQGEPLRYVAFDLTRLSLRDVRRFPYEKRTEAMTVLEWDEYPNLEMIDAHSDTLSRLRTKHQEFVDAGYEGTVWKMGGSGYSPGRSTNWRKFKHEQADEAVVTGFKPGQGEFQGMIGAVEFELSTPAGTVSSRASGMDLGVRQDMTDNPSKWIGSVIEIRHNGIMTSGKPRHPRYLRRRDDRSASELVEEAQPVRAGRAVRRDRAAAASKVRSTGRSYPGASKRNYGAMSDEKLLRSVRELERGSGEAFTRCVQAGGNPLQDEAKATDLARARGLL